MAALTPTEFLAKWKTSKLLMNASSSYNTQIWKEFIEDLIDSLASSAGSMGNVLIYRALMDINGAVLSATVLNPNDANYLGAISWAIDSTGVYHGTLVDAFPSQKVNVFVNDGNGSTVMSGVRSTDDLVIVKAFDDQAAPTDDVGLASVMIIVNQD